MNARRNPRPINTKKTLNRFDSVMIDPSLASSEISFISERRAASRFEPV